VSNFIWANNVNTTIAGGGISAGATSVTLASTENLPNLLAGEVWALTFKDQATESIFEIVYVTDIVGPVCTIVRGQEGTTAQAWLNGDFAYGAVTAGELAAMVQAGGGGLVYVILSPGSAQSGYINLDGELVSTSINTGNLAANHVTAIDYTGSGAPLTNVIHSLTQGGGISITGGSNATITNTGVKSIAAQAGDVSLISSNGSIGVAAGGGTIDLSLTAIIGSIFRKQLRPSANSSVTLTLPTLPGSSSVIYDLYAQGSGDTVPGGYQQLAGSGASWESGSITVPDSGAVGPEPIDYIGTATGGQTPSVTYTFQGGVGSTGYIGVFSVQATARP